jgi:hypothetical protein
MTETDSFAITPLWFVPIHVTQANGEGYDLCRWPQEYADKLEEARKAMHEILLLPEGEMSMQSVVAQAAAAEGVKREDLCLYLLCLGLIRQA